MKNTKELTQAELDQVWKSSFKNYDLLSKSDVCLCFFCLSRFSFQDIKEWISEFESGKTAVCPLCGIDSVIGSKFGMELDEDGSELDEDFLLLVRRHWFGESNGS